MIAGIFTGAITSWDDSAIAADNPDRNSRRPRSTPSTAPTSRARRRTSPTTSSATAGDIWTYGAIEAWDADGPGGGEGAPQTSGVVAAINAGEGSIGYADASQVGDLSVAKIKVGDEFVEYSPEAAAKLVDASERVPGRSGFDFSYSLVRDTTESGVYPIALVATTSSACSTTARRRSTS